MSSSHKFIIVDDDQDTRFLLRRLILRSDSTAQVVEASNGQDAVKLHNSSPADVMIIDHNIPLLDGLSLIRLLRAQFVSIPLILTSENPQVEREAVAAGATQFLTKEKLFDSLRGNRPAWLD